MNVRETLVGKVLLVEQTERSDNILPQWNPWIIKEAYKEGSIYYSCEK